jgi:type II secretory pathway component PulC
VKERTKKELLMKYPLWILNSSLLFLILIVITFAFVSRQRVPYREAIVPEEGAPALEREGKKININKIYEHDLFGTYVPEVPLSEQEEKTGEDLPTPPTPKAPRTPEIPRPQFLEPLNITLKGIIVFVRDSDKNCAIIENNQTKQEACYKLGDTIEDAQLIRILSNKVLFLRSNGQQEVLYLKENEAQADASYASIGSWSDVVKKTAEHEYAINKHIFAERVPNLGSFIDLLSITSVYKKGISVGCRIGQLGNEALGKALGFEPGDLIISVNGTPATSTENRLIIYKGIMKPTENEPISVEVVRGNKPFTLLYTISNNLKVAALASTTKYPFLKNRPLQLSQNNSYNASIEELHAREQNNMLHMSTKPREEVL